MSLRQAPPADSGNSRQARVRPSIPRDDAATWRIDSYEGSFRPDGAPCLAPWWPKEPYAGSRLTRAGAYAAWRGRRELPAPDGHAGAGPSTIDGIPSRRRPVIAPGPSLLARSDVRCWLAIGRAGPRNGHAVLRALEAFGSIDGLFGARDRELAALGFSRGTLARMRAVDWDAADRDRDLLGRIDASIVPIGTDGYPPQLAAIASPPPVLYCRGNPEVLGHPQLAIVGARAATRGGCARARAFARALAQRGLVVTSGLARGIDAAAHRGALDAGAPGVAVAATGPDRVYPRSNADLAHELMDAGAVITEFAPETPPLAANFPRRNRIISGLSLGILVVEASPRSGSLITARLAADEGREVFAVPGSVDSALSRGCHSLIRDGAKLVESVSDVIEEFAHLDGPWRPPAPMEPAAADAPGDANERLDAPAEHVLQAVGHDPVAVDQLVEHTGLTANRLSSILLALELDGRIDALPGGRYVRTGRRRR